MCEIRVKLEYNGQRFFWALYSGFCDDIKKNRMGFLPSCFYHKIALDKLRTFQFWKYRFPQDLRSSTDPRTSPAITKRIRAARARRPLFTLSKLDEQENSPPMI